MLASYAAGLALTAVLAVANGSVAGGRVVLLYLPAFTAFMAAGGPGRGPPPNQRHRLAVLGHWPAGKRKLPGQ
jgi:hypothetical protein